MLLLGTYHLSVADDGCVALPEKWRSLVEDGELRLRFSPDRTAVEGIAKADDGARQDAAGRSAAASGDSDNGALHLADPICVELRDGSFVLPADVREALGIADEAVLTGDMDAFWIWGPEAWRREQGDFDMEELLGIPK